MMKALELTVFHAIPCGGPCQCDSYILPDGDLISAASVNVEAKRLTDAELAAEYWAAAEEATSRHFRAMYSDDAQRIEGILYRMARLPHYDDPTETGTQA